MKRRWVASGASGADSGAAGPSATSAPSTSAGATRPAEFDRLPDELLERVLLYLGAQEAWRARLVCGRFRACAGRIRYPALRVASWSPQALDDLATFIWRKRLRLAPGASVDLTLQFTAQTGPSGERADLLECSELVRAACGVLRAAVHVSEGAGLRAVRVHSEGAHLEQLVVRAMGPTGGSEMRWLLLPLLNALRPSVARANYKTSALRSVSCSIDAAPCGFVLGAVVLRHALEPLAGLRSLSLPRHFTACEASLQAIAQCLRGLRRLEARIQDERHLAALAPLASLEVLRLWQSPHESILPPLTGAGVSALADGPAGRSLRSLRFAWLPDAYTANPTWLRTPPCACGAHFPDFAAVAAGVLAVGRMPCLEELDADLDFDYFRANGDLMQPIRGREDAASLGGPPLRALRAHVRLSPLTLMAHNGTRGLADAILSSTTLHRLDLCLYADAGFVADGLRDRLRELLLASAPVLATARLAAAPESRAPLAAALRGVGKLGRALAAAFEAGVLWRAEGQPADSPASSGRERRNAAASR